MVDLSLLDGGVNAMNGGIVFHPEVLHPEVPMEWQWRRPGIAK